MAVQLILKNSAVQDKEATAAQLAAGELALNYHSSGPFLQCEDTAGNIWRLGGVVIASTAPSSPSKGAWWLDSDDNHLYFYNGSSWIEIQTGEIVPGDITEGTARQLLQTNAAGNGTEWTSDIDVPGTLDVTGVATFDNNVVITGNLTVNGTTTTIDTTTLVVEDKNIEMGAVGTPTDSTADGGGITLKGATDKTINWVNATDAWTSSERFSVPLGAEGTPSLTFTGDANTGIYSPGADQVAISTNGQGRLFVDANGNVGLGTASPLATANYTSLTIDGTNGAQIAFRESGVGNKFIYTTTTDLEYRNNNTGNQVWYTSGTERLRIDSSGRLLVGTSTARSDFFNSTTVAPVFQIQGTGNNRIASLTAVDSSSASGPSFILAKSRSTGNTVVQSADSLGNLSFQGSDGSEIVEAARIAAAVDGTPGTNDMPGRLVFSTTADGASSPTERMRIDSSGRVGVGTTSPAKTFEVNGTAALKGGSPYLYLTQTSATGQSRIYFGDPDTELRGYTTYDHSDDSYRVATASNERLRIDSSGRVGIGTSSPTDPLTIACDANAQGIAIQGRASDDISELSFFGNNGTTQLGRIQARTGYFYISSQSNGSGAGITIDSSSRVGIGTTSPSSNIGSSPVLDVSGSYGGLALTSTTGTTSKVEISNFGSNTMVFATNSAERARIDSSGRLLVGTSTNLSGSENRYLQVSNSNPFVIFHHNGNNPAANTTLAGLEYGGQAGGSYVAGAFIRAQTDGNWASGDAPTRLVFSTTADGASSPTERVRIEATGKTKFSGAAYGVENTITASAFNLNNGNLWTCGAIAIPNPTNAVAGLMGSIRVTAAPTSFGSNFDHPGGSYTAPTSFPAVAPFYCVSSTNILLGSWTQGIA